MQDETIDFRSVIISLVESKVRFVLIVGLAMIAQGAANTTLDVVFSYDRSIDNLASLVTVLKNCHAHLRDAPHNLPFLIDVQTFKNVINLTLTTDFGDLGLLAEPAGVDSFEGLWSRADEMQIFGMKVKVACLEDILAMKRASDRPKDRLHILELQDLQQFLVGENMNEIADTDNDK